MRDQQVGFLIHRAGLTPIPALLLLLSFSVASCQQDPPPVPEETTITLLADLHLAKARADLYGAPPFHARDSILALHNMDSTAFNELLDFYADHPNRYNKLYSEVLDQVLSRWDTRSLDSQAPEGTPQIPSR